MIKLENPKKQPKMPSQNKTDTQSRLTTTQESEFQDEWIHSNPQIQERDAVEDFNPSPTTSLKSGQTGPESAESAMVNSEIQINNKNWTEEEVRKLFQLYKDLGSRWTMIARKIITKSENSIKNKFNCSIRKFTRKLNKINKEAHVQFRKQIRTESVFRILEATQLFPNMEAEMKRKSLQIREQILIEAQNQQQTSVNQNIIELIDQVNGFNLKTRSHKNPKNKRRKDIICLEPVKQIAVVTAEIVPELEKPLEQEYEISEMKDFQTEDRQSEIPRTNIFLDELESCQSHGLELIMEHDFGNGAKPCFWNHIFEGEGFCVEDHNLWFSSDF